MAFATATLAPEADASFTIIGPISILPPRRPPPPQHQRIEVLGCGVSWRIGYFGLFPQLGRVHGVSALSTPAPPDAVDPNESRLGSRFRSVDQDD